VEDFGKASQQLGTVEGLEEVASRAVGNRGGGGFHVRYAGDEHDRQRFVHGSDLLQNLGPGLPRHLHVEENEVGPAGGQEGESLAAVGGQEHLVAFPLQDAGDELPDVGIVVDLKDHGFRPACRIRHAAPLLHL
jgi:hypothetical protein